MNKSIEQLFSSFVGMVDEVPFGNSDWQNRHTIVNEELTPYRAYRHSALRIINRFNALREAYYSLKEKEIESQEQRDILSRPWWKKGAIRSDYERRRVLLKIEKAEGEMPWTRKLISDAINEITCLLPVVTAIGPLPRDEFESQEHEHFEKKLNKTLPKIGSDLYTALTANAPNNELFEAEFVESLHVCATKLLSEK